MRIHRSATVNAALAALLVTVSAAAQTADAVRRPVHIDNFGQINANYYRGAQPRGGDYAELAALGVKTVIDLTQDGDPAEPAIVKKLGMNFHRIPMTTRNNPTSDQVAAFLKLVNDPANQPVYVHCQGGRHRTGVMTAIYRMNIDGWAADRAFAEMKQYKYGPDFLHPEFKGFVFAYKPESPHKGAEPVLAVGTPAIVR